MGKNQSDSIMEFKAETYCGDLLQILYHGDFAVETLPWRLTAETTAETYHGDSPQRLTQELYYRNLLQDFTMETLLGRLYHGDFTMETLLWRLYHGDFTMEIYHRDLLQRLYHRDFTTGTLLWRLTAETVPWRLTSETLPWRLTTKTLLWRLATETYCGDLWKDVGEKSGFYVK